MTKRAFDFLVSAVALVTICPGLLIIAAVIKATSPGPVFFRQTRVGQRGQEFRIHKFRTMIQDADRSALSLTAHADSRITPIGRTLRAYKLDELPQLIDVFLGRMSLVGPRPELPKYVALYPPDQRREILSVRPGMTDPASIAFRNESLMLGSESNIEQTYIQNILPQKLRISLNYVRTQSLSTDLAIIARTIVLVSSGK